jgi:hypothetical protein
MSDDDLETKIEPGMKVAVRRGVLEHIGEFVLNMSTWSFVGPNPRSGPTN